MYHYFKQKQERYGAMATERSRSMETRDHSNGVSPKNHRSRGNLIYLMTVVLLLMAVFASCKKDRSGGGDGNNGNASVINAAVVNGNDYNGTIFTVKMFIGYYYDAYVVASGKYENGGFKLTLPETVPCVENITDYCFDKDIFDEVEGTISDPKANIMSDLEIFAFDSQGEKIGDFSCEGGGYFDSYTWIEYVYVDRNCIVKCYEYYNGEYIDEKYDYDCSFTKGWNIVYVSEKDSPHLYERFYTTTKPSGVNYKWYYYYSDDWKKIPIDRRQPFSKIKHASK